MKPNFNKCTDADVNTLNTPYDYKSVMHYGTNYFSINGSKTLVPLDPTAVIGQHGNLSSIDIEEIQIFYGCILPKTATTSLMKRVAKTYILVSTTEHQQHWCYIWQYCWWSC
ncbi:unnamed protein product [Adineta ricciae]|uniref:Metalloendopeptidase n=1 Tax=Adineta ricciae TaxID=249248 RepID=A0A814MLD4_ADIRI|nr:unnamed protein product [Adineta ricciae]CAF1298099.1 unnamed protein product [Adineta ricciae]